MQDENTTETQLDEWEINFTKHYPPAESWDDMQFIWSAKEVYHRILVDDEEILYKDVQAMLEREYASERVGSEVKYLIA